MRTTNGMIGATSKSTMNLAAIEGVTSSLGGASWGWAGLILGLALSSCSGPAQPPEIPVHTALKYEGVDGTPPARPPEKLTTPPHVWIDGHWNWLGRWVWQAGRWVQNKPNFVYVEPSYRRAEDGAQWRFQSSYWVHHERVPSDLQVREARGLRPRTAHDGSALAFLRREEVATDHVEVVEEPVPSEESASPQGGRESGAAPEPGGADLGAGKGDADEGEAGPDSGETETSAALADLTREREAIEEQRRKLAAEQERIAENRAKRRRARLARLRRQRAAERSRAEQSSERAKEFSNSSLKTEGFGKSRRLRRSQFSSEMRAEYDIFAKRCTKCHAMSRPIMALLTGRTPISGAVFDERGIKKYVLRMMRKPKSGINREETRAIVSFLLKARRIARSQ